jgi:DNA adenine methylase
MLIIININNGGINIRYFGGKTRTYKQIANILNTYRKENQIFLSPFVGGAWVEQLLNYPKICCDKHPYLIAMYKALQEGWIPPKELSKEEYEYIKNNKDEKPYLTGFVGFGCSFAGQWFGGYAKDNTGRNYCLNAHNSILKKMELLKDTKFECKDYRELTPENCLIYCDPPYEGTTQYDNNLVGEFDSNEFWDIMRRWSKNNTVFISEYNAPDDFKCIWSQEVKLDIRDKDNKKKERVEKLYTYNI